MPEIKSFRDLRVYQQARAEAKKIFVLTRRSPREEMYSLTDQIRRSSRAVGAMLAEAWARRRYEAAFISKTDEGLAEATETQVWLGHALDSGYISPAEHRESDKAWERIGGMLARMIDRAETFCNIPKR
jgi:four helix bundle protein